MTKPKFPYARLARECGKSMELHGDVPAILAILVLVKLEKWFGKVEPQKMEYGHFLLLMYLGAEVLKTEGHK